jgi:hypothetical protein
VGARNSRVADQLRFHWRAVDIADTEETEIRAAQ